MRKPAPRSESLPLLPRTGRFTATPKSKTLQLFGTPHPATGNLRPFHVYSMRQAIDEGFILDVLSNYVTYKTYWRLSNANADDREVDQRKASAQLARFAVLSPASLQQRAEIIMDHFHDHIRSKLQGRAKAMVVTSSRDHAVRLYRKLVAYGDMRGYDGCGVLVAFSGELEVERRRGLPAAAAVPAHGCGSCTRIWHGSHDGRHPLEVLQRALGEPFPPSSLAAQAVKDAQILIRAR